MKRRIFAFLLALILALLLCEIHVCCGEGCLFCARVGDLRKIVVCAVLLVRCALRMRIMPTFMRRADRIPRLVPFTLVDLKVRLSD